MNYSSSRPHLILSLSTILATACAVDGTELPDGDGLGSTDGQNASSGGTAAGTGGANQNSGGATSSSGGNTSTGAGGASTGGAPMTSGGTTGSGSADSGSGGEASGTGGGASQDGEIPSMGCGTSATLASGTHSIQVGGDNRSFILRIPENYDNSHPHRLIFAFHWRGGTMGDVDGGGSSGFAWSYYGLREQAGDSTIFVAPQGIGNGWENPGGRDLALLDAMVSQIKDDLCIDESRVFSMGFSWGGGMSYGIACDRADVFRGVAVYSGGELSGCGDGSKPVAYLGIHGISDSTTSISGGHSLRDRFVGNNGCTPMNPPEPNRGSLSHVCTSYEGCGDNPVRWCAFDGGHTPGPVDGGGDDGALTWTKQEAWDFISQF